MYSLPTFQKLIQSTNPIVSVLLVGRFEPHQCALNVRLWGHWPETESRVRSDQTVIEFPLWFFVIQCLPKYSQHCGEKASENSIEESVEKKNFRWKEEKKPVTSFETNQLVFIEAISSLSVLSRAYSLSLKNSSMFIKQLSERIAPRNSIKQNMFWMSRGSNEDQPVAVKPSWVPTTLFWWFNCRNWKRRLWLPELKKAGFGKGFPKQNCHYAMKIFSLTLKLFEELF